MADIKRLLALKKKLKATRPVFHRQQYSRGIKISKSGWRRPRGMHSKLRQYNKGKGFRVNIGYGVPAEVRGLHKSGMQMVNVSTLADLKALDKNNQLAIIASRLGQKKKVALVKEAKSLGIKVQNLDVDKYLAAVEEKLKARKDEKKKRAEKKKTRESKRSAAEKKKEAKLKDADKKASVEDKISEQKAEEKKGEPKSEAVAEAKEAVAGDAAKSEPKAAEPEKKEIKTLKAKKKSAKEEVNE